MARYIDADKLIAEYDRVHIGVPGGARKLMVEAPTADVVPRAELAVVSVQKAALEVANAGLRNEIKKLETALLRSLPSYCQVISKEKAIELGKEYGRREVAREIFKDLNEMVIPEKCTDGCAFYLDMEELAELKKKYTEEE